jgi:YggT family protein
VAAEQPLEVMPIVHLAIEIYSYIVLASVIMSWVQPDPANPLVKAVHALTEPVLKPIRAVLPTFMGLDFSPIVLFLGLGLIQRFL